VSENRKSKFLSETDLQTLLQYVKKQADLAREKGTTRAIVDEMIILLLARVGLRAKELQALKIKDLPIDNGERVLKIRNAAGRILRAVDISEDMVQLLTKFIRLYRKGAKKTDALLETERGNPFGYMSVYGKVRRIGEQAGIGPITPSILQHTYMVRLYEKEQDLRYVQEQTGYLSRRTLAKYLMKGRGKTATLKRGSAELTSNESSEMNGRHTEPMSTCEACGAECSTSEGRRIESGQFLCHKCLEYFHTG
jgi:integrase/recombinase XerD